MNSLFLRRPLLTLAAAVFASASWAQAVRLDFGTDNSPLRQGFTRVTHATEFKDGATAGWVKPQGLVSKDQPLDAEWKLNPSSGRTLPPIIYTTDIRRDHVGGDGPATLRLRLPNGKARLWLLCSSGQGSPSQVWDLTVACGGASETATFHGQWSVRAIEMPAEVKNGLLDITFTTRSRWAVCALVAATEAQWPVEKKGIIAKIEQETFLLPDEILKTWEHRPYVEKTPLPKFTAEEQKQGFVIYTKPWVEPIWPNTSPKREEIGQPLRAFASQDEYEPLTFTIYPLRPFAQCSVTVSDLRASSGQTIPAATIDTRYVRYMNVRPNYSVFNIYYRAPDVLMPFRSPQPLAKGENFRVWLTVHTDAFAPAGLYRGEATVNLDGKPAAKVPIIFRVLPIKLQKDESIVYGFYYRHPYSSMRSAPDTFSRLWWNRKAEAEALDMVAHGNNAIVAGIGGSISADGKWTLDFDYLQKIIDLCRRHGFDKPIVCSFPVGHAYGRYFKEGMGSHLRLIKMPPPKFFEEITACVAAIEAGRKARQWPELLYYPIDEPSTSPASVAFMTEIMKAIKRVPGVRTYVTADPDHGEFKPMWPYVDVWCCQPFSLPRDVIVADMKKRPGVEYWCYPNHISGENDHTPVPGARMTYGFGFWRSGFRALTPWIYQSDSGDPWNYLDGGYSDFFNRTDDDGSPIPVAFWEAYREGIDDGRYITTLERTIDAARAAGHKDLADAAQADLKFVWDAIQVMPKYKEETGWEPESFDVYRWVLARQILRLQEAINGGTR